MTPLPTGVGNREEQKAFLQEHSAFLAHYPVLKQIVEKAVCRTLAPPPQSEVAMLRGRLEDDAEAIAFENKATTDRVIFLLARIAVEDFSEILILAGNGRGIGAYKVLRGMYERVVHAVYLDKNEEASRRFVRQSDVYKYKLAKRLLEFGIDILSDFTPTEKTELEKRAKDAKNDKSLLNLPDMAEQAGQDLKPMYGPCHLEPTIHIHANAFGMERRLVKNPGGGFTFNDADYRPQSNRALLFGHNLLILILVLQNSRFNLGMEEEMQECVKAFKEIWGEERTDPL